MKQYIELNQTLKKIYHEEKPMYIMTWIFGFISVTYSILPFSELDSGEFMLLFFHLVLFFSTVETYMLPYLKTMEQGKMVPVYEKYKYAPIDLKQLYRSQLRLLSRFVIRLGASEQAIQLLIWLVIGHNKPNFYTFMPLYSAGFAFLFKSLDIRWLMSRAKK